MKRRRTTPAVEEETPHFQSHLVDDTTALAEEVRETVFDRLDKQQEEADAWESAQDRIFIPTGSTLFNLAMSDSPHGGWQTGKIANLIGDSSSGKTFLALSCFAEMARDKRFDDYAFVYDDVEAANEFNMSKLFGKASDRIIPPVFEDGEAIYSDTIQDFRDNVMRFLDADQPFVYILDSLDALTSEEEITKTDKEIKARKEGKVVSGSYGMDKAKSLSGILRRINGRIKKSKSVLIVVSQTRDDINPMSFTKKTRSGGKALKFYATHEIWTAVSERFKKKELQIGINCKAKITKNKITGKIRTIDFPIYYSYGIDDIASCVKWLVNGKFWKKKAMTIDAAELGIQGTSNKIINHIEENKLEGKLKEVVGKYWKELEDSLELERKPKYE